MNVFVLLCTLKGEVFGKEVRNSSLGRGWSVDRLQRAVIYFS